MLFSKMLFCTIITSETLLMDRTYIVTPTVTGEPEITKEKTKRKEGNNDIGMNASKSKIVLYSKFHQITRIFMIKN